MPIIHEMRNKHMAHRQSLISCHSRLRSSNCSSIRRARSLYVMLPCSENQNVCISCGWSSDCRKSLEEVVAGLLLLGLFNGLPFISNESVSLVHLPRIRAHIERHWLCGNGLPFPVPRWVLLLLPAKAIALVRCCGSIFEFSLLEKG